MNDLSAALLHRQFQSAQAAYEAREAPEFYQDDGQPLPFSNDWADAYIDGLAQADDAFAYLDADCIDLGEKGRDVAELLKALAVAFRVKPDALADLIGARFFRTMKALAAVAHGNQQ